MTRVVGLDLSLTSTGIAVWQDGEFVSVHTVKTAADTPIVERLRTIRGRSLFHCRGAEVVVIESPVVRSSAAISLGMVRGVVLVGMDAYTWGAVLDIAPSVRAKLATGKGNAGKAEVLAAAIHRLGYMGHSDDEADALWLATAGALWMGVSDVKLPQNHLDALKKLPVYVREAQQ